MRKKKVYFPYDDNYIIIAKIDKELKMGRVMIKIKRIVNANFPNDKSLWREVSQKRIVVSKEKMFEDMDDAIALLIKRNESKVKKYEEKIVTYSDLCSSPSPLCYNITSNMAARIAY